MVFDYRYKALVSMTKPIAVVLDLETGVVTILRVGDLGHRQGNPDTLGVLLETIGWRIPLH
jgi:hypothetical protein